MDDEVLNAILIFGILGLLALISVILVCIYLSLFKKGSKALKERVQSLRRHEEEIQPRPDMHKKSIKRTTIVVAQEVPVAGRKLTRVAERKKTVANRTASAPESKVNKIIAPGIEAAREGSASKSNPSSPMRNAVFIMPVEKGSHKTHSVVTAQTSSEASSQGSQQLLHRSQSLSNLPV